MIAELDSVKKMVRLGKTLSCEVNLGEDQQLSRRRGLRVAIRRTQDGGHLDVLLLLLSPLLHFVNDIVSV